MRPPRHGDCPSGRDGSRILANVTKNVRRNDEEELRVRGNRNTRL
jgi:hypothetical protein